MNNKAPLSYTQQDVKGAWHLIQQANTITLLTHHNPDPDTISAAAALDKFLAQMGKETEAIYLNQPDFPIKRQPAKVLINQHSQVPDLIIVCDTANYARMYYPDAFKNIPLINIDHHISNSIKGTFNLVNSSASSACEELFILMRQWHPSFVDKDIAECLLFGILYDTQLFQTQGTTAQTLRLAADLMGYGANIFQLKTELLSNKSPKICALWGYVLSNIQTSPSGKASWASITQAKLKELGVKPSSLAGFSNFLWQITDVDVTMIFYETESGKTDVSLRAKTSDVNAIAKEFGGGGHTFAAGISSDIPMDQLIKQIVQKIG